MVTGTWRQVLGVGLSGGLGGLTPDQQRALNQPGQLIATNGTQQTFN